MPQSASYATDPTAAAPGEDMGQNRAAWSARFLQPQTGPRHTQHDHDLRPKLGHQLPHLHLAAVAPRDARAVLAVKGYSGWALSVYLIQMAVNILVSAALIVAVSDICLELKPNLRRAYRRGFANGRLLSTYFIVLLVWVSG